MSHFKASIIEKILNNVRTRESLVRLLPEDKAKVLHAIEELIEGGFVIESLGRLFTQPNRVFRTWQEMWSAISSSVEVHANPSWLTLDTRLIDEGRIVRVSILDDTRLIYRNPLRAPPDQLDHYRKFVKAMTNLPDLLYIVDREVIPIIVNPPKNPLNRYRLYLAECLGCPQVDLYPTREREEYWMHFEHYTFHLKGSTEEAFNDQLTWIDVYDPVTKDLEEFHRQKASLHRRIADKVQLFNRIQSS